MKKIILLLSLVMSASLAFAHNDKPITIEQLPDASKQLIKTYFSGAKVAYAKMETELFDKSYEVVFVDGNKLEFDKRGEWKDVDCKYTQVPAGIVPQKIQEYITANHQGAKVVEIDRDSYDYELKLSSGLELKFDLKFNIIGIDD